MSQKSKNMVGIPIITVVIVFIVSLFFIPRGGNAEGGPSLHGEVAGSFEEHLDNNLLLKVRYEGASAEKQLRMRDYWEAQKEKWNDMSEDERTAMKANMKKRMSNSRGKGGFGNMGN